MRIDANKLINTVDPFFIIEQLPIQKQKKNNDSFLIECLNHNGKKDKHLGNCTFSKKRNSSHCFGCGSSANIIEIVKLSLNVGFVDACRYLADFYGGIENFYKEDSEEKELLNQIPYQSLDLIGLKNTLFIVDVYESTDSKPQYLPDDESYTTFVADVYEDGEFTSHGHEYCIGKVHRYSLTKFMEEDPEGFLFMMGGKIKERLEDIETTLSLDFSRLISPEILYRVRETLKQQKFILRQLSVQYPSAGECWISDPEGLQETRERIKNFKVMGSA